jgi:hypothetical protein
MAVLIGDRITRFFEGDKYVFERVAKGEWKCVYKTSSIVPRCVIEALPN